MSCNFASYDTILLHFKKEKIPIIITGFHVAIWHAERASLNLFRKSVFSATINCYQYCPRYSFHFPGGYFITYLCKKIKYRTSALILSDNKYRLLYYNTCVYEYLYICVWILMNLYTGLIDFCTLYYYKNSIFPKYWDLSTPYTTYSNIWKSPFYYFFKPACPNTVHVPAKHLSLLWIPSFLFSSHTYGQGPSFTIIP